MNNSIIKVYSHERSGTNFLIHALYENFYKNNDNVKYSFNTKSKNDVSKYYVKFDDETNELNNNAMFLFGSHLPFSGDAKNKIYIIRNPYDCLYSFYKLQTSSNSVSWFKHLNKNINYEEWLTESKILTWKKHVLSYINNNCYVIKYEQLVNNYENILLKISDEFNLKFINDEIVYINKQVGWIPETVDSTYDDQLINKKFKSILSINFLDYNI